MSLKFGDRIKEICFTIGQGALTLSGAAPGGFKTFATVLASDDFCYYCIECPATADYEVGYGTYNNPSLTRDRIIVSSNANPALACNFPAGTKYVYITTPSEIYSKLPVLLYSVKSTGSSTSLTLPCQAFYHPHVTLKIKGNWPGLNTSLSIRFNGSQIGSEYKVTKTETQDTTITVTQATNLTVTGPSLTTNDPSFYLLIDMNMSTSNMVSFNMTYNWYDEANSRHRIVTQAGIWKAGDSANLTSIVLVSSNVNFQNTTKMELYLA